MDYQVVLSPSARADLRDIVRYISFDAPNEALHFGRFLVSRTKLLAGSPELGRIVPEFEDVLIREIIVRSYRVVYRLNDSERLVEVIRFCMPRAACPKSINDPKSLASESPNQSAARLIRPENFTSCDGTHGEKR